MPHDHTSVSDGVSVGVISTPPAAVKPKGMPDEVWARITDKRRPLGVSDKLQADLDAADAKIEAARARGDEAGVAEAVREKHARTQGVMGAVWPCEECSTATKIHHDGSRICSNRQCPARLRKLGAL